MSFQDLLFFPVTTIKLVSFFLSFLQGRSDLCHRPRQESNFQANSVFFSHTLHGPLRFPIPTSRPSCYDHAPYKKDCYPLSPLPRVWPLECNRLRLLRLCSREYLTC